MWGYRERKASKHIKRVNIEITTIDSSTIEESKFIFLL